MERPMTQVMVSCGLVDIDTVQQLKKWKMLSEDEVESWANTTMNTPASIVQKIHDVLESEDLTEMRDTELDVVGLWLRTRQKAKLHVPSPDDRGESVSFPVEYYINGLGEYVIPWTSESIRDLIIDENTYLKPLGKPRVQFMDVRELFYASTKAFIVCTPVKG